MTTLPPTLTEALKPEEKEKQWCDGALTRRITTTSPFAVLRVFDGKCLLLGAFVLAGAAEAILRIWDSRETIVPPDRELREKPAVKTATYDGYVNIPMMCNDGIIVQLSQTDAEAWLIFYPLT
jgi:hypothetical protein